VDSFTEAIRLEPTEPTHYFKLGSVLLAMDRFDEALQAFSSAIHNAPYYVDAYRKAAEALERLERADLAAQYREQADEIEAAIRERLEQLEQEQQQQLGQAERLPGGADQGVLSAAAEAPIEGGGGVNAAPGAAAPPPVNAIPTPAAAPNPFEGAGAGENLDAAAPLVDENP
jgi:tetratricopeptide (TPR) repeat protein